MGMSILTRTMITGVAAAGLIYGNVASLHAQTIIAVYAPETSSAPPASMAIPSPLFPNENRYYSTPVAVDITPAPGTVDKSIASITYRIDAGPWMTVPRPTTTAKIAADGIHHVDYYATDSTGRDEAVRSIDIDIDRTPPTTTASVAVKNGGVTHVTLTPVDAGSGVFGTYFSIDTGQAIYMYSGPFDLPSGKHTIEYWSEDNAYNLETHHTLTLPSAP